MIIDALTPWAATPAADDDFWYRPSPWSPGVSSSQNVTSDTALALSCVFACVRVRAETIAQLPLHLMQIAGKEKHKAFIHSLYRILHDRPNHWQTAFDYRLMMQAHLDLRGNAYSLIVPGNAGSVSQLIPLHPDRMQVFRLGQVNDRPDVPDANRLGYLYSDMQGHKYKLLQDEVHHLRGLSLDGVLGLSPIGAVPKTFEVAMQIEDHGLKFLTNAGKPSGALKMPEGKFIGSPEQHADRRRSWQEACSGNDLYKVVFLEDGMEWQQLGITNQELEWLESAKLSDRHIAQIYRVPLHLIMDWERLTYNNAELADLSFVKHTVLPICTSWEQAISRDLISDPVTYYSKFAVEGLLRGDSKARMEFYKGLSGIGVFSPNDVRELEDMNPIEGGDQRFIPQNMMPLEQAAEIVRGQNSTPEQPVDDPEKDKELAAARHQELLNRQREAMVAVAESVAEKIGAIDDNVTETREDIAEHRTADTKRHAATVERFGDLGRCVLNVEARQLNAAKVESAIVTQQHDQIISDQDVSGKEHKMLFEQITGRDTAGRRAVIHDWIGNAAERLAAAEIAELSKRADKAAGDREKFDEWASMHFTGKQRDYVVKTLVPIVKAEPQAIRSPIDIADKLAKQTITELTNADPVEVLATWRDHRAGELRDLIEGELYCE